MKIILIVSALLILCGCFGKRTKPAETGAATGQKLIVTPGSALVGKVAHVNPTSRFAILTFPIGHLPAHEQRFSLYRRGLKVGEVKITGPQYDDNVVADITAGDCEIGDQARAE